MANFHQLPHVYWPISSTQGGDDSPLSRCNSPQYKTSMLESDSAILNAPPCSESIPSTPSTAHSFTTSTSRSSISSIQTLESGAAPGAFPTRQSPFPRPSSVFEPPHSRSRPRSPAQVRLRPQSPRWGLNSPTPINRLNAYSPLNGHRPQSPLGHGGRARQHNIANIEKHFRLPPAQEFGHYPEVAMLADEHSRRPTAAITFRNDELCEEDALCPRPEENSPSRDDKTM